jgi:hypothetical protein
MSQKRGTWLAMSLSFSYYSQQEGFARMCHEPLAKFVKKAARLTFLYKIGRAYPFIFSSL